VSGTAPPAETPEGPPEVPPRVPLAIEDVLAALGLGLLVVITFGNVLVRYFTDQSFAWTEEIAGVLMLVMTLAAAGAAAARDLHIRIEYFFAAGTPARQRRLGQLSAAVSALFFLALAVLGARMALDEFRFEDTSPAIGLPKWIYTAWLPLLALAIAGRSIGRLRRMRRDR